MAKRTRQPDAGPCQDGQTTHRWSEPWWAGEPTKGTNREQRSVCLRCKLRKAVLKGPRTDGRKVGTYYPPATDAWDDEPDELLPRLQENPKPTRITWCDQCGRCGVRDALDELDEECRYCGGTVYTRTVPSKMEARREAARRRRERKTKPPPPQRRGNQTR